MGRGTMGSKHGFHAAAVAALALALGAGCGEGGRGAGSGTGTAGRGGAARSAALEGAPVCQPVGAHARHEGLARGCETCHSCGGGTYGFPEDLVLARGTTTAGGEIVRGSPTTCSVGCHNPFGAPTVPIAWDAAGPLRCTQCHAQVGAGAEHRSAHAVADPDPVVERDGCQGCHALGAHLSGTVRIALGDGTSVDVQPNQPAQLDAACRGCHDGDGSALAGRTPPVLVGWTSPSGDFHGTRSGSGWGGTLAPPYVRGQGPLPCTACHDAHASGNAFLFAGTVNGAAVAPGRIDRAGVGGEALCASCHVGERHAGCVECHGVDPMPASSPCFFCHGHEGIVGFVWPSPHHDITRPNAGCNHCHGDWMPALERVPPAIASGGLVVVRDVTATGATIQWETDENATSYVEYGVGVPSRVAGTNALVKAHSVALTGLVEATTYTVRVRSSDRWRNVTLSAGTTFSTASAHAPLAPVLVDQPHAWVCEPRVAVTLGWSAVADPDGDPVQYRVVLDDGASFESPFGDSGWIDATQLTTTVGATTPPTAYYWRVIARDAAHDLPSPWSAADTFSGVLLDPNDCFY